jgi:hypothetical protein
MAVVVQAVDAVLLVATTVMPDATIGDAYTSPSSLTFAAMRSAVGVGNVAERPVRATSPW